MLPIISEENVSNVTHEILQDIHGWRKAMIHYIKEENPELNSAIIEIAQKAELDPKALATGAYMAYKLIESQSSEMDLDMAFEEE